jgi:hypothetical protein
MMMQTASDIYTKKPIVKVSLELIAYEIVFISILRIALIFVPHQEHEFIYYLNINLLLIIACLILMSRKYSKVNKILINLIVIWLTFTLLYSIFFLFCIPNFSVIVFIINYHILSIFTTTLQLLITYYVFLRSLFPHRVDIYILIVSIILSGITAIIIYLPYIVNIDFTNFPTWDPLFTRDYYMNIMNFSLLVVFWHQYTQNKIIFSEYLSNILALFTIIIGIEIFHFFSFQYDIVFYYLSQYFYAFLYSIMLILWFLRLNYLKNPDSKSNEEYIENYFVLHGFVSKPRQGLLFEFYSNINKSVIITSIIVMIFLGFFLFFFDNFEVFVGLNLLLLIIAVIISLILSIVTWHRRWYDAVGFLFRGNKVNKKI